MSTSPVLQTTAVKRGTDIHESEVISYNCELGKQTWRAGLHPVSFSCRVSPAELSHEVKCEELFPDHRRQRVAEPRRDHRRGTGRLPCNVQLGMRRLRGFVTAGFTGPDRGRLLAGQGEDKRR